MDNVEIDGLKFRAHKGVLKELVFQGYDQIGRAHV